MDPSECRCKTAGGCQSPDPVWQGSIMNGGVFHCFEASERGLSVESVSPAWKRADRRLNSADGSGVLSQCAVGVSNGCRRSTASKPFMEDYGDLS